MRWALALSLAACGGPLYAVPDSGSGPVDDGGSTANPDADALVAAHNAVRARAMPAPSPALPLMAWSADAAAVAAAWVEGCDFKHNPAISGGRYGENIFAAGGASFTPQQVVEDWASEAPQYTYATNTCSQVCGHYTQIVWRSSTGVGCASKTCTVNNPFGLAGSWAFWVCDYTPPGNISGQRPY